MNAVNKKHTRIIFDLILLSAVFYTPWWVVAVLAFGGAFMWPMYYEIFIYGMLFDLLYGAHLSFLGGMIGIVGSVVIFFIASYAKNIVR